MTNKMRGIALAATLSLALISAAFAQDAMAPAPDAMAPAAGAMMAGEPTMPPISDEDFALCMEGREHHLPRCHACRRRRMRRPA